jgi:hypothetical protein
VVQNLVEMSPPTFVDTAASSPVRVQTSASCVKSRVKSRVRHKYIYPILTDSQEQGDG